MHVLFYTCTGFLGICIGMSQVRYMTVWARVRASKIFIPPARPGGVGLHTRAVCGIVCGLGNARVHVFENAACASNNANRSPLREK